MGGPGDVDRFWGTEDAAAPDRWAVRSGASQMVRVVAGRPGNPRGGAADHPWSSQERATRRELAAMVRPGLTPPLDGSREASHT
ncbi:hypothetical protein GCM10011578_087960 [Streptomyces fuscichromogenes]|uniref:Uncharacterized protein n=1 Tax=Streptomyces fuscichromogenes TaxID=1324013 RepID=A0A917XMH4_9ACTN|nr:hypothetical protein GCM10011578_087960 [Streptomyces fuscichromogenes]